MRAMLVAVVLAAVAAACGGEVIDYSPTATRTPVHRTDSPSIPPPVDRLQPAEDITALTELLTDPDSRLGVDSLIVAAKLGELRAWTNDLDNGATSRAELVALCADVPDTGFAAPLPTAGPGKPDPIVAYWRIQDATLASLCDDIRNAPHALTLRGWADLIERRFGSYEDLTFDLSRFEDG